MTQETLLQEIPAPENKCPHHWIIEAASGPTSTGVCRLCGAEKQFQNYVEGGSWDDDRSAARESSRRRSPAVRVAEEAESEEDS